MPPRFFCPTLISTGSVTLTDAEAHHLAHVLRQSVGDIVELFNGRGLVGSAVVQKIGKRDVICEVTAITEEPPSDWELTLATAVPKGDRFDWLVEKATELGVSRLVPLITTRSTVDPRGSKLDRLRQTVIAACKQCRRSRLMELTPPRTWLEFLEEFGGSTLLVAHPGGLPLASVDSQISFRRRQWTVAVGPEGGFTAEETAAATECGGQLIGLGRCPLRIETAGLALAAWGLFQQPNVDLA